MGAGACDVSDARVHVFSYKPLDPGKGSQGSPIRASRDYERRLGFIGAYWEDLAPLAQALTAYLMLIVWVWSVQGRRGDEIHMLVCSLGT